MEIIILGAGCAKCKNLYSAVEKIIADAGIEATLKKEEDIMNIMAYGIMTTPAIVVDGVVKIKGYIPAEAEIKKALSIIN
jgi:small redox-active disulfide protein 2